jgi:prophage regulatory protein
MTRPKPGPPQLLPLDEPDRLLRLPEVIARVGLKRSAIYQRMSEGRFPRARSLGTRCTVWVEAEIKAWVDEVVSR